MDLLQRRTADLKELFCFLLFFINIFLSSVLSQNFNPFGEGLAGLDVSLLHEIAVALDPSLQPQPGATWNQPAPQAPLPNVAPSCTGKDGFFPDYVQNCRVYYRCSPTGRMARFECPLNFIFSEPLKRCDAPERVVCLSKANNPEVAQTARAVLPDPGILSSGFGSNTGSSWPGLGPIEGSPGFYEPILTSVTERPQFIIETATAKKVMGEPQAVLDIDPDICFGRPKQYIPDADTGCRGYILCAAIFSVRFQSFMCPAGMRFDIKSEQCLPKGQVRCIEVERLFPTNFNFFARSNPSLVPELAATQPPLSPCLGKTGFVPDYAQHCRVYYYCNADGSSLNLTCPTEMVFNPSLQSCDFFQTAPECKAPIPAPQRMGLVEIGTTLVTSTFATALPEPSPSISPWSNPNPRPKSLLPFQNIGSPSISRPSPGLSLKSINNLSPGLLSLPQKNPSPLTRPSALQSAPISGYAPMSKSPPLIVLQKPAATVLEGAEPAQLAPDVFGPNRVNTGNPFGKAAAAPALPGPVAGHKAISLTVPATPAPVAASAVSVAPTPPPVITVFETECDGIYNGFHIEPESACRIYHYCHPNMTMETFTCPPDEVFVVNLKSCVPLGVAICVDALSSDAKDLLHKNWVLTTQAPNETATTVKAPLTEPTIRSAGPGSAAASPEPQCAPGTTGLFADVSTNCGKYYECHVDGSMVWHSCPVTLKFNANLKACDWPEYIDANCNEVKGIPVLR